MCYLLSERGGGVGGGREVTLVAFFGGTGHGALDGLAGLVVGIPADVLQ